jgi:hypothetical protein
MLFTLRGCTRQVNGTALPSRRRGPNGKQLYKFVQEILNGLFISRLPRLALALGPDFPTGFRPSPHPIHNYRRYASLIGRPQTH